MDSRLFLTIVVLLESSMESRRKWAARLASQAGKERDSHEMQRLISIAEYWKRLADLDDWERDGFRSASEPNPPQRGP
jgi:hypothetical protein